MTPTNHTATRLMAMLRWLNIDIRHNFDLNMPIISDAARQCGTCAKAGVCDIWFDCGAKADGYRTFCPNVARFDVLPHCTVIYLTDRTRGDGPRDHSGFDRAA